MRGNRHREGHGSARTCAGHLFICACGWREAQKRAAVNLRLRIRS